MNEPKITETLPAQEQMTNPDRQVLPNQSEWTFELIDRYNVEIRRVADSYGLDYYPHQFEIITASGIMRDRQPRAPRRAAKERTAS